MQIVPNRVLKWDNLKFILIFLVVFGHILDVYAPKSEVCGMLRFFIYTFHMPLFLFVSGLFSKRHIKGRVMSAIISYLVLYLLIKVLVFASKWAAYGKYPGFSLFSAGGVPWYAFVLFAFCLITMALDRIEPKYVLIFSVILGCLAGYDGKLGDYFCLSRIFAFYPFFFAGYMFDEESIRKFADRKAVKIASAAVIAAALLIIFLKYDDVNKFKLMFTGRNSFKKVLGFNAPYAFLIRLACYGISTVLGTAFISLAPNHSPGEFMAKAGASTLQIYALHMPLKYLYFGLLNDRFGIEKIFVSKLPLYSLLVTLVIFALCMLPFWNRIFVKVIKVPAKRQ